MAVPILTPAGPLSLRGKVIPSTTPILATTVVDFTSDQNVTWTTDNGSFSSPTPTTVTWKAPNMSGTWHVYAENAGHEIRTITIVVEAVVPNYWEFQNPIEVTKKKLEFEPVEGPTQHRVFGSQNPRYHWELGADDSDQPQYFEMRDFWNYHDPGRQFLMWDPVISEIRRYETDSDYSAIYKQGDGYSWKFRIKEVWPYAIIT